MSDVTCRSDKLAKSVIIPLLQASGRRHDTIIATATRAANPDNGTPTRGLNLGQSPERMRELAHKSAECRDR